MASEVGKPAPEAPMSAERGATPGAPEGSMETPEAVAIRFASQLHANGLVDALTAVLRARDEEWTRRVAQGWAEGRDAAAAHMRALCDKNEGKLFCDGIAGENCRWNYEIRKLKAGG